MDPSSQAPGLPSGPSSDRRSGVPVPSTVPGIETATGARGGPLSPLPLGGACTSTSTARGRRGHPGASHPLEPRKLARWPTLRSPKARHPSRTPLTSFLKKKKRRSGCNSLRYPQSSLSSATTPERRGCGGLSRGFFHAAAGRGGRSAPAPQDGTRSTPWRPALPPKSLKVSEAGPARGSRRGGGRRAPASDDGPDTVAAGGGAAPPPEGARRPHSWVGLASKLLPPPLAKGAPIRETSSSRVE